MGHSKVQMQALETFGLCVEREGPSGGWAECFKYAGKEDLLSFASLQSIAITALNNEKAKPHGLHCRGNSSKSYFEKQLLLPFAAQF